MPLEELAIDSSGVWWKEEGGCGERVRPFPGRVQTLRLGCHRCWHGALTGHCEGGFGVAVLDAYQFSPAESDRDRQDEEAEVPLHWKQGVRFRTFLWCPPQEAIERAERLHDRHKEVAYPGARNLWTDIHLLVRRLLEQS